MTIEREQGEYSIGRYTVSLARFSGRGWRMHGPWMRAVVTNCRLYLIAGDTRSHASAYEILPQELERVSHICLGRRDGVMLVLKRGEIIYLFIDWAQGAKLAHDLSEMLSSPVQPQITPRLPGKQWLH